MFHGERAISLPMSQCLQTGFGFWRKDVYYFSKNELKNSYEEKKTCYLRKRFLNSISKFMARFCVCCVWQLLGSEISANLNLKHILKMVCLDVSNL